MSNTVRRIVLVVAENLRCDVVERFTSFNLARLVNRGAAALDVESGISDLPAARLASLLTGVSPLRHGVTTGGWNFGRTLSRLDPLATAIATEGFQTTAFLPQIPLDQARRTGFIGRDLGFQQVTCRGNSCSEVVSSALNALCTQRRGLITIQFGDMAGIDPDTNESDYRTALMRLDQSLGILASLSGAGSGESRLMILGDQKKATAISAGDVSPGRTLSLIMFGRGIRQGTLDSFSLLDIPPTILWSLGISVPRNYEGRVLVEAFSSVSDATGVRHSA